MHITSTTGIRSNRRALIASTSLGAVAMALSVAAGPSFAQTAPASVYTAPSMQPGAAEDPATQTPEESDASTLEEVVVTATRIDRAGFVAPTPMTTVGAEQLAERAATHVRDILYDLPQVVRASPGGTGSGSPGGQYVNLRNLGNLRTLVLVDGRRVVPTNINGSVDLNIIPSSLVERLEVVTGGASAAWGSDAVSGVVNLILKRNIEGVQGSIQYNVTQLGDNEQKTIELAAGHDFMDGRLRFMIAGEASSLDGIANRDSRDWGKPNYAYILNPTYTPTNGQFRLIPTDRATYSRMTAGGVINDTILRGTQFGPGGQPTAFTYGTNVATLFQEGGSGGYLGGRTNLVSPLDRNNAFTRLAFDVNDRLTVFAEGSYAYSHTRYDIIVPYDQNTITIQQDNAFLPAAVRATMVANNLNSFTMGRINYELGDDISDGDYTTTRFVLGAEGRFNDNWKWSGYYQHGENDYNLDISTRLEDNWRLALDSVISPTTGRAVCRSTLTSPTNGCIPANVFGPGSIDPSVLGFVNGVSSFSSTYTQDVVAADLRGDFGATWAGPISIATGLEYREESLEGTSDANSQLRRFRLGNSQPISGSESVKEGFFETVIPLARDLPFALTSDLNAAVRYASYRLAGDATTWKVGLTHEFNDQLRFRATRSRDLRAPKLNELFQPSSAGSGVLIDRFTNTQPRVIFLTTGNTALVPEAADTLTYGIVFRPSFVPGLQTSIDVYDINIEDAIGTIGNQDIIDRCFAGATSLCPLITRVDGVITQVTSPQLNLNRLISRGIDFEASYGFDLADLNDSWNGRMNLRLLGSKIDEISTNDGITTVDRAGEIGSTWRVSGNASYRNGPLTLAANFRYIGDGTLDNTYGPTDVENNHQGARAYVGASIQYTLLESDTSELTAFARVDNLLDSDPPVIYGTGQQPHSTDPSLYDVLGRNFAFGLRFKFQ